MDSHGPDNGRAPLTILFTDVEGSTGLWERHGQAMALALRRHDEALREIVSRFHGTIVKGTGDGFLAAFASSSDAVQAVLHFQQRLSNETAVDGLKLRVRCGLDLGPVDHRGGDLYGLTVSRAARVMDAAHGGQVLMTESVARALPERLPANLSVRDLGPARLRGISSAVRIYQLAHPGLRPDFPALRSLEATPHNLPNELTSFVGREAERQQIADLLRSHRLVTLVAMGGLGKTRLALRVGMEVLERFADGVWFVDLSAVRDAALIPAAIARVLSIREQGDRPVLETVTTWLRSRTALVLIDNCEHLLDAVAETASSLLAAVPALRVLATSREALGVMGEQTYAVSPLAVPRTGAEGILACAAARLFIDRVRLQRPGYDPTASDALHIADICARVEGIPLALELAAARANSLSLAEMSARLRDRLGFLARTRHMGHERQRTMRALVAWSFALLDPKSQILFARLSIFSDGFDLEAVASVCAAPPLEKETIEELLAALVDKSLVSCDRTEAVARNHMLETLRDFAAEQLSQRGESSLMEERHFHFFFELAKAANRGLSSRSQGEWIRRLETDLDNLRAAFKFPLSGRGDPLLAVKLQASLQGFWVLRGFAGEGRKSVRDALALDAVREHPRGHPFALYVGGVLAMTQGDYREAVEMLEKSLRLRRETGNEVDIAASLSSLALTLAAKGEADQAGEPAREALQLFRKIGDRIGEAIVLAQLAQIEFELANDRAAERFSEESSVVAKEIGHLELEAEAERMFGQLALARGDAGHALQRSARSLAISTETASRRDEAVSRALIAKVHVAAGEWVAARMQLASAVEAFVDLELKAEMVQSVEDCAVLACRLERPREAAIMLGAADAARTGLALRRSARSQAQWDRAMADVRNALGVSFDAAWAEGASVTLRDVCARALSGILAEQP